MSVAIRVEGLTRRFGRRWALRGIDLEIPGGIVVALLGANGTGKTTLLRVLSTLLRPTGGRVEVLGELLPGGDGGKTGLGASRVLERVALMTPGGHAYDELTGLENLRFAARMSGSVIGDAALREALAGVQLDRAADTRVGAYSTGMRRRLELARMRQRSLELALLDEPFASLDEQGVELVHDAIAGWRRDGAAVIVASHRVDQATRAADEVIRLERGVVAESSAA